MFSAKSSSWLIGSVGEVMVNCMMGWSAGLFFLKEGGLGMPAGNSGVTSAMAVCTSTAALSISRSRLNCSVIWVLPVPLDEVIESRPAMVVNCRSSTVATEDAMVAGSAPGRLA